MAKGASKKAGAPAVVVDRSGGRVRLRNIDHALPWCISTDKGELRGELRPNEWATVPDSVYQMLKSKFYNAESFTVPDWVGSEQMAARRADRKESYQDEYMIEFPDEAK